MGMGKQIVEQAQMTVSNRFDIPVSCPQPEYGFLESIIQLWLAKWGAFSLIGGSVLGWTVLGLVIFHDPINKVMTKIFGFSITDLKETVRRRKERDKELKEKNE